MGKAGSTTVYRSIINGNLFNSVYKVNFLSDFGIKKTEELYLGLRKKRVPNHLKQSKILRKRIDKSTNVQWKVITLVRDPVGREISEFFYEINRFHPELVDKNGNIKEEKAVKCLRMKFRFYNESRSYTCNWFKNEFERMFNLDVYSYPFDHDNGFTIIKNDSLKLLILKMEKLNSCFNFALNSFFESEMDIEIVNSNIQSEQENGKLYKNVVDNFTLNQNICKKIYSSRYAKHFYSKNEIDEMMYKWSNCNINC